MTEPLRLFAGYGIELEYMIVERESLRVSPRCDALLEALATRGTTDDEVDEIALGDVAVSNELAAHVVEIKTNGPAADITATLPAFMNAVAELDALAAQLDAMLLPTAMHPTMDPEHELRLWSGGQRDVYDAYDRIFGCRGHGWANLQSAHLNLPFGDDEELGRLHAAVRAVLPLLPALAASSPLVEGHFTEALDHRLVCYAQNQRRLPSIIGNVIPEPAYTRAEYFERILTPMFQEIAPLDPQGMLQHEWLNSRGAIARFERNAIEIRVLDVQETPAADLCIARIVVAVLKGLVDERWASGADLRVLDTAALRRVFDAMAVAADEAWVEDDALLAVLGHEPRRVRARDLWQHLAEQTNTPLGGDALGAALRVILERGCLARRIVGRIGRSPSRSKVSAVYRELADCLVAGRSFVDG